MLLELLLKEVTMDSNNEHPDNGRNERRSNKKKKFSKIFWVLFIVFFVTVVGAGLGFLTASLHTMPDLKNDMRPAASSEIYDCNGNLITTLHATENRIPVSIQKIPKNLQDAFIATEDARFYQNMGIDPRGILRAAWTDITGGTITEGGSTITQQLAKNALLTQTRTFKRKIQEVFLALQIEQQYTKPEILEMYLNQIYFGQGAYGVQAAARTYFGKNVQDLNLAECAMLAGIPKSPNYFNPFNNLKAAKERQAVVLDQLVKYHYIDQATADAARNAKLHFAKPHAQSGHMLASYFVDYVTQYLIDKYGANAVYKDGLKVYTTLDLTMQEAAENAMKQLPTFRTDHNGLKQPQGALVAIDPHNGYIKAMVGGRGTDQFNRAVMAVRQPGSAFKPFVYLAAIESGMTASTMLDDTPATYGNWTPKNDEQEPPTPVTLRYALEHSLNIPTVRLTNEIGVDKPLYYAQQMGITTLVLNGPENDRNLAMALGGLTRGVTPLDMASAYGVFADQGVRVAPTAIIKVVDRNGKVLEQNIPQERSIVNPRSAYIITDILRGVIKYGTGMAANINRPAAGKTGTTSDFKDAWFVGFTPDLSTAVWIGDDNNGTLHGIYGGMVPAKIWRSFMLKALAKTPPHDFVRPSGIISETVSNTDGLLDNNPNDKNAHTEIYIDGTQPTKFSSPAEQPADAKKQKPAPGQLPGDTKTPASPANKQAPKPSPKPENPANNSATLPPPPPKPANDSSKGTN
jgi:penicillin-binding protein 1A